MIVNIRDPSEFFFRYYLLEERNVPLLFVRSEDCERKLVKLLLVEWGGGVEHDVAACVVLGERDAVADGVEACEE